MKSGGKIGPNFIRWPSSKSFFNTTANEQHTGGVTACTTCKLIESAKTLNSAGSLFPAFVAQVFIQGRRHSK
ncbi:hypothetical protein PROFUN_16550 [Planoprotostelium fungivorum]|uniref:Uncharacterized protein n=1 Tax=Planoprotostelium fungivorum TaxID=1890364 RepID=A0A2P6MQE9_9EUKA|nr:hypothetical protein PROFUN_16550 [Planoprotostelium fungivorum]